MAAIHAKNSRGPQVISSDMTWSIRERLHHAKTAHKKLSEKKKKIKAKIIAEKQKLELLKKQAAKHLSSMTFRQTIIKTINDTRETISKCYDEVTNCMAQKRDAEIKISMMKYPDPTYYKMRNMSHGMEKIVNRTSGKIMSFHNKLKKLEKQKTMLDRIIKPIETSIAQQQKTLDELYEENAYYDALTANAEAAMT
jgi:predicted nuclease with TOPRIM domain